MGSVKLSRNDPCPCGSGHKYKRCCMGRAEASNPATFADPAVLEAQAIDARGQQLLGEGRVAKARSLFERSVELVPALPWSHNNLALCDYLEGDLDGAVARERLVIGEIAPESAFAHAALAQYLLHLGRRSEAESVARTSLVLPLRDGSAVGKVCETLAHLEWDAELAAVVDRPELRPLLEANCRIHGAVAHANLGRREEALEWLRGASERPGFVRALRGRLRRGEGPATVDGRWPYFSTASEFVSAALLDRVRAEMARADGSSFADAWFAGLMLRVVVLEMNACSGDDPRHARLLVELGTAEAITLLRRIAAGRFGSDALRYAAAIGLRRVGALRPGERPSIWSEREGRAIEVTAFEITDEAVTPMGMSDDDMSLFETALATLRSGRAQDALDQLEALDARTPGEISITYHRAVALAALGRTDTAREIYEALIAADPTYLFPRAALAGLDIGAGHLDAARATLEGAEFADRVHPDAYAAYLATQTLLELACGEAGKARMLVEQTEALGIESPALEDARERVEVVTALRRSQPPRSPRSAIGKSIVHGDFARAL